MNAYLPGSASFFSAVRARPYLALTIFALSQLTAAACWLLVPHNYKAQATVLLDSNPSPVQLVKDDGQSSVLAARMALLRSRLLADRLVVRLKLDSNPLMRDTWESLGPKKPPFDDWLAQLVASGLVPELTPRSYMLRVGYASPSPEFATALANAYATELIDLVDVLNRGYDQIGARKIDASVSAARARWLASQKAVQAEGANAPLLPGMSDPQMRQFMLLNAVNTRSAADYIAGQAANDVVTHMADPGDAMDDAYLTKQQGELGDLRTQRSAAVTSLGAQHPVVKGLDANISAVEDSIKLYKVKRRSSMGVGVQVKRDVLGAASGQAADAKDALLESVKRRRQYDERVSSAEQAGEAYEQVLTEQSTVALNKDIPRSDLQLLALATPPDEAWFPQWYYYMPISLAMGFVYVLLGCGITEMRDRRVRSVSDVVGLSGAELAGRVLKG
jgi:succinoglycan biosynthesis transport protein ExoP